MDPSKIFEMLFQNEMMGGMGEIMKTLAMQTSKVHQDQKTSLALVTLNSVKVRHLEISCDLY